DQRVAQRVNEHDGALVQALRVRSADEILAENIERLGAQDARVIRDTGQRQHERRQKYVPEPVGEVPNVLADREHALAWEPPQLNGEDDDEDETEPEGRHGMSRDAENADRAVTPGAALQRGDH